MHLGKDGKCVLWLTASLPKSEPEFCSDKVIKCFHNVGQQYCFVVSATWCERESINSILIYCHHLCKPCSHFDSRVTYIWTDCWVITWELEININKLWLRCTSIRRYSRRYSWCFCKYSYWSVMRCIQEIVKLHNDTMNNTILPSLYSDKQQVNWLIGVLILSHKETLCLISETKIRDDLSYQRWVYVKGARSSLKYSSITQLHTLFYQKRSWSNSPNFQLIKIRNFQLVIICMLCSEI